MAVPDHIGNAAKAQSATASSAVTTMTAVFKIDVRALRCANKSRARSNTARPTSARTRSYADAQETVRGIDRSEIGDVPAQERLAQEALHRVHGVRDADRSATAVRTRARRCGTA